MANWTGRTFGSSRRILNRATPKIAGEAALEIPRHISILSGEWPARGGYLGPSYDAFQTGDPANGIPNLKPRVDEATLARRSGALLQTLDSEFQRGRLRDMDRQRTLHRAAMVSIGRPLRWSDGQVARELLD